MNHQTLNLIDRMDEIATCYAAIGDLMSPDGDLQERQRNNIAVLMEFLRREYESARDQLSLK